jgi:hypothetical protein
MAIKIYQNHILCLCYLMYFQYDGCKWLLTIHTQHYKMKKKKHNWPIIDPHNKMTHPQYKCQNKTFTYHSLFPSPQISSSLGIITFLLSKICFDLGLCLKTNHQFPSNTSR